MPREPGDPLYEYEQTLLREEQARREAEAARAQRQRSLDPRNMSTMDQIRYKKAETAWAEAVASGDPTAADKTTWIMTRMQGTR